MSRHIFMPNNSISNRASFCFRQEAFSVYVRRGLDDKQFRLWAIFKSVNDRDFFIEHLKATNPCWEICTQVRLGGAAIPK